MPLQLFINDLSAPTGAVPHEHRVRYLKGLVATVRAAKLIDERLVLNCEKPVNELSLGDGASISTMRNDNACVEESQYLKTLAARAPLSYATAEADGLDAGLFEYKLPAASSICASLAAPALGLAHMLDGLALSFPFHDFWRTQEIDLDLFEMNDQGIVISRAVAARNACAVEDVDAHADALRKILRPRFRNGRELWAHRAKLFPNLVFIPRTRAQIEGILSGDPLLDQAWTKLSGIDQAIAAWGATKSACPLFPFNVRPESKSRMGLVKFNDENGVSRVFSDHADLAPIEGRIHFIVESKPRRQALIGHVGRKLGIG